MTFPLTTYDGYKAEISLQNSQGEVIYKQDFNKRDDFDSFISDNCRSRSDWGISKSCLIPVRTNIGTNKGLYKDLFLPTVVNRALTVNGLAKKSFAILFSLALDILTLPARLITVIPRALYNAFKANHPLHDILIKKEVTKESIGDGNLTLKCLETTSSLSSDSIDLPPLLNSLSNPDKRRFFQDLADKYLLNPDDLRADQSSTYFPSHQRSEQLTNHNESATERLERIESIERDIKLNDIPDGTRWMKGLITTVYYKKINDQWKEDLRNEYVVPLHHFRQL